MKQKANMIPEELYSIFHAIYNSFSLIVWFFADHSLSLIVLLVVTRYTTRCHSLSFVVPLVVTRCITRLSYKRSLAYIESGSC